VSVPRASFLRSDRGRAALGLAVLLLALGAWRAGALPPTLGGLLADAANSGPSERDIELATQNYYQVLMDTDHLRWGRGGLVRLMFNLVRGEDRTEEGGNWVRLKRSGLLETDEEQFLADELKADYETVYMGVTVKTNHWRMRDRDYPQEKPPGTFRIALVGSSNDMGYGVAVDRIYPELLEDRLERELGGRAYQHYEVLNFSVGGYQLLHRLYVADHKVPPFHCDMILYVATMHDLRWAAYEPVVKELRAGRELPYEFLRTFAAGAGLEPGQSALAMKQRLRPRREALVKATFEEMRRVAERQGALPVLANFRLRVDPIHPEMIRQTELAREAGLVTLEIFDSYEGRSDAEMYLTSTDTHPTAKAHALLADELYRDLLADDTVRARLLGETLTRIGGR
jgi:hypothetical protein